MMDDLIRRKDAIDALDRIGSLDTEADKKYAKSVFEALPSAQQQRILYANMSDAEFEKWLYEHGICHPDIHGSMPCEAVPLLIDNAINELPSAQPEQHLCRDCKWGKYYGNVDKNGNTESYWLCMNRDGGTDKEGYCYEWESR